jgi:hypothetical protein
VSEKPTTRRIKQLSFVASIKTISMSHTFHKKSDSLVLAGSNLASLSAPCSISSRTSNTLFARRQVGGLALRPKPAPATPMLSQLSTPAISASNFQIGFLHSHHVTQSSLSISHPQLSRFDDATLSPDLRMGGPIHTPPCAWGWRAELLLLGEQWLAATVAAPIDLVGIRWPVEGACSSPEATATQSGSRFFWNTAHGDTGKPGLDRYRGSALRPPLLGCRTWSCDAFWLRYGCSARSNGGVECEGTSVRVSLHRLREWGKWI